MASRLSRAWFPMGERADMSMRSATARLAARIRERGMHFMVTLRSFFFFLEVWWLPSN